MMQESRQVRKINRMTQYVVSYCHSSLLIYNLLFIQHIDYY